MIRVLTAALTAATLLSTGAVAQVVEENPAPVPQGTQRDELADPVAPDETLSREPLGVDLAGIIVAPSGAPARSGGSGVDISALAEDLPGLSSALAGFIGQPLSQALIGEIRTVVIAAYRKADLPLVSVTVPPQEVTGGVLQLAVTVFTLGEITTDGNTRTSDAHLLDAMRVEPGETVDSAVLLEDLNWLNLNPYRNVVAVFEPGRKAGETNLTLRADEVKPWQVYAGYQNSGVESSDRNRIFAGFNTAGFPGTDHLLSYQLTASPDFWWDGGLLADPAHAAYESHSVSYFVPLPWRHKLTMQASYIDSDATLVTPFTQAGETVQVYADYAVPVDTRGDIRYDAYGLAEWKLQEVALDFAGLPVRRSQLGIAQFGGGIRGTQRDAWGRTGFDVRVVASPGGLVSHNEDSDFVASTGNPDADATYAYLFGTALRSTPVDPIDATLVNRLRFQVGSSDLPGIEQFSVGGVSTVRGYEALELSGEAGVSLSNELRFDALSVLSDDVVANDLVPFGFVDVGYVSDDFSNVDEVLLGTGFGASYSVSRFLSLDAALGFAVLETRATDAGDARAHVSATIRY